MSADDERPPRPNCEFRRHSGRNQDTLNPPRISIRNLDFYYGSNGALRGSILICRAAGHWTDRAVRLRKIHAAACAERMDDLYPGQRATGEVLMDGENIIAPGIDLNELRARMGMVFQRPTPFPMSIAENIAFGVRLHERLARAAMNERVEWSLSRAALWGEVKDRLGASALGLSGGQQQRLCIARAIAVRPEVILLDEPTSALDPISTLKIEELIEDLKKDFTIALVTHNMQQAARVADQVAFLFAGELVEVSPAVQMFTAPKERRTQDYITGRFG